MSRKKSMIVSDHSLAILRAQTRAEEADGADAEIAWSQGINEALMVCDHLIRAELPELAPAEWEQILNAYAGCLAGPLGIPFRIASDLMDDLGVVDLSAVAPEVAALIRKLHGYTQAQQFAILSVVRRFWARDWAAQSLPEIIRACVQAASPPAR